MRHIILVLVPAIASCALTEKAEVIEPRLFEPRLSSESVEASDASNRPLLQLGTVTAAAYLKAKMAFRASPVELRTYDDREWTERPETYLERSLARALYGSGGASQAVGGTSPMLDAELLAFEEVRTATGRSGRVAVHFTLHDDERVLLDATLTDEEPARSKRPEDVVDAIGAALDTVSHRVATEVTKRIAH